MKRTPSFAHARRARGLTLVELMVSLVIGMLLVAAMATLFVANSRSRREVEISADAIESGRYAIDLLTRELSQAGFYGTVAGKDVNGATNLPCSTNVSEWNDSLPFHVIGWNSAPAAAASVANPACLSARKVTDATGPGTDAIYIQRASTCYVGEKDGSGNDICKDESGNDVYLQVSECASEYNSLVATTGKPYVVARGGTGSFTLHDNACGATNSVKRKLIRRIYYVDQNENALKSIDLNLGGAQPADTLVENIEQMQIEYAIAAATSAGTAQTFSSAPTATDWPNVVGARVWVVARSTDLTRSAAAASNFVVGDFDGSDAAHTLTFAAATTNPKRRVYSAYIPFNTPKIRVEQ